MVVFIDVEVVITVQTKIEELVVNVVSTIDLDDEDEEALEREDNFPISQIGKVVVL